MSKTTATDPKQLEHLRGMPAFNQLAEGELRLASACMRPRRFEAGASIAAQGDLWPWLFFVNKGGVKAVKVSAEGRSLVLAAFHTGEIFWGLSFFLEDVPMPATLVAEGETELHLWPRSELLPLILANGRFSWELTRILVERAQFASEIVEKLAFQPVAGRLARLLLDQKGGRGGVPMPRNLTLDEMAARIGTTREVVSRVLHQFSDDGIINVTRSEFTLEDPDRLNDLAQKAKG